MKSAVCILAALLCASAQPTQARTLSLQIDPTLSSIDATIGLLGSSDSDQASTSGTITFALNDPANPRFASLEAFNVVADTDLLFTPGGATIDLSGLSLTNMQDQAPIGPVTIGPDGAVSFAEVPVTPGGSLFYEATFLQCLALSFAGVECSDTINAADLGNVTIETLGGVLTVTDRIRFEATFAFDQPVIQGSDAATIDATITVVAFADLPCPGDFDGDGDALSFDVLDFLDAISSATVCADRNGDSFSDFTDLQLFLDDAEAGCNSR